ncbi:hypothetical protein EZS27_008189 [termite gut metagenome]|uniref:Transposase DDE domain-containing protein n=1 Tax=termite gut metagenome TaxID=433724 RepID=A0A5J4SDE7_9ZZZZ
MSKVVFKSYDQGQTELFPSRLDGRIGVNSPVRLINSIVDKLEIGSLLESYCGGGTSAYHPRMLLKVVFYAYMNNVYSCRRIEDCLNQNIHYMWLSGSQYPSFSTINRFRSEHLKDRINSLFTQVVLMLVQMGQITLETQYVDGTKIESVSNKYTFVWKKSIEKNKANLESKIASVLSQIEEGIAQDSQSAEDETPVPLDSAALKSRIEALNEENQKKEKVDHSCGKLLKELAKKQEKLEEYEQHLKLLADRNSYSKTDPDATFMRMKEDAMNNGQTKPGYNVQLGTEHQYITNFGFYQTPADTTTLPSFLDLHKSRFGSLPKELCADAGYGSEQNYERMEEVHVEAFVKYNYFHKEQKKSVKNNLFLQENLSYMEQENYFVCPSGQKMKFIASKETISNNGYVSQVDLYQASHCQGCPLRSQCHKSEMDRIIQINHKLRHYKRKARERLTSRQGLKHRSLRPVEPEAVFGQIKFNKQYKRFRHRGLDKINMDFGVLVMAFNIKKLYNRYWKQNTEANVGNKDSQIGRICFFFFHTLRRVNYLHTCA